MKSLQNTLVFKPIFFILIILFPVSLLISYFIEKKDITLNISNIESIRDIKYQSLNKDNLQSAFDFTSLNYVSYILDEKGTLLFSVNYNPSTEIINLCANTDISATNIVEQNGLNKLFPFAKTVISVSLSKAILIKVSFWENFHKNFFIFLFSVP